MKAQLHGRFMTGILIILTTSFVHAQTNFVLKTAKASVHGSSSLHEWESEITKIDFAGTLLTQENVVKEVKYAEIKILVTGIKSTKGKVMDNKTYDAFLYEKNPHIIYRLTSAAVAPDGSVDASGALTMAGTTKPMRLAGKSKVLSNGDVQLTCSKKIKMTDFKMEPPTAIMGTIKVGDEVEVLFDLILTPHK